MHGLRHARDRCGHQRALVAVEDGLRLPFVLPAVLGEFFCWRSSRQLPAPDPKFRSEGLRPDYDGLLAGRPASIARLAGHNRTATTELVYRHELRPVITTGAEVMGRILNDA